MHGGAPNDTDQIRYAVLNFHCRARMKPFCDHTRSIPHDIVESASPTLRRLWGFECQSAWEESPRNYQIIEVTGAKPRFEYRGIGAVKEREERQKRERTEAEAR